MEITYLGHGKLSYLSLKRILEAGVIVKFVHTVEDDSKYSVKELCERHSIAYSLLPIKKYLSHLTIDPDENMNLGLVSVNYKYIVPVHYFESFKWAFNVHGALLPKYRGRTPHVWALINGEKIIGVTSHIMIEKVDAGPIIIQKSIVIMDEYTINTVMQRFEQIYPELVLDSIKKIEANPRFVEQKEEDASYYGKRVPEMGYIYLNWTCKEISDFVRAQTRPYPGAYIFLPDGRKMIIYAVSFMDNNGTEAPKLIVQNNEYQLHLKNGRLKITDFEVE